VRRRILLTISLAGSLCWTFAAATLAEAQSSPGAAYAFSEGAGTTTADSSGNGNTGTLSGSTWTTGAFGGGLSHSGSPNRVLVTASQTVTVSTAFTAEAWVYPTGVGWVWNQMTNDGTAQLYILGVNSDGTVVLAFTTNGTTNNQMITDSTIPFNAWTHLAATYDGSQMRIYINGVEAIRRSASGTIATSAQPVRLGVSFNGVFDEVRIYRSALSAAAIALDMVTPVDTTGGSDGGRCDVRQRIPPVSQHAALDEARHVTKPGRSIDGAHLSLASRQEQRESDLRCPREREGTARESHLVPVSEPSELDLRG